jgi:hypothetical protein
MLPVPQEAEIERQIVDYEQRLRQQFVRLETRDLPSCNRAENSNLL